MKASFFITLFIFCFLNVNAQYEEDYQKQNAFTNGVEEYNNNYIEYLTPENNVGAKFRIQSNLMIDSFSHGFNKEISNISWVLNPKINSEKLYEKLYQIETKIFGESDDSPFYPFYFIKNDISREEFKKRIDQFVYVTGFSTVEDWEIQLNPLQIKKKVVQLSPFFTLV